MDDNRIEGTARNVGGKVQEGVGRLTGNVKSQAEGLVNQAAGTAQDLYGQTRDSAVDDAASLEKWFRHTIETQPYATAAIALAVGWFIGRSHRPF
jgi:uncharacterized protein YjbJ (UPF0337 family)